MRMYTRRPACSKRWQREIWKNVKVVVAAATQVRMIQEAVHETAAKAVIVVEAVAQVAVVAVAIAARVVVVVEAEIAIATVAAAVVIAAVIQAVIGIAAVVDGGDHALETLIVLVDVDNKHPHHFLL